MVGSVFKLYFIDEKTKLKDELVTYLSAVLLTLSCLCKGSCLIQGLRSLLLVEAQAFHVR